jgi:hypothetical protein
MRSSLGGLALWRGIGRSVILESKKIPLNAMLNKAGQRLVRIKYVRRAIDDRANLSEFRKPPTVRILAGVFLITISMIMCWPLIVASVGWVSWHLKRPWILTLIVPIYVLSHACYLMGMFLSGEKYTRIFLRWLTRCSVERMLGTSAIAPEKAEA